jgi:hypothetical protein
MTTFRQQDEMAKLVEQLARMDTPEPHDDYPPDAKADEDAITRAIEDAGALYDLIESARAILKGGRK